MSAEDDSSNAAGGAGSGAGPSCERTSPWTYAEARGVLAAAALGGIHPSLDTITELCRALGDPQGRYPVIQVAGTNGKTSTARMIAAIMREHGLSVGLYTSPDLGRPNERIEIDGQEVDDAEFARAIGVAADTASAACGPGLGEHASRATEFELLTAAAIWLFADRTVDVAVLEVGLGGRWDATSVAHPGVSVITGVGIDHAEILGITREAIAAEKAQTVRDGGLAVLGPGTTGVEPVFTSRAEEVGSRIRAVRERGVPTPVPDEATIRYEVVSCIDRPGGETVVDVSGIEMDYPGLAVAGPAYQAMNAATAAAASEALLGSASDPGAFRRALAGLEIPGRFEVVCDRPATVIVDVAHNPQGAEVLADAIVAAFGDDGPTVLLGVLADKDVRSIVEALVPAAAEIVVTEPVSPRALGVDELTGVVADITGEAPRAFASVGDALDTLVTEESGPLIVTGSVVTAGEARTLLRESFC